MTEAEEAAAQLQMTNSAFVGWQILAAMGADVGTFDAYLTRLGLT